MAWRISSAATLGAPDETTQAGHERPDRLGDRARLHGHERLLFASRRRRIDRDRAPRARSRHRPARHLRHLRAAYQRRTGRPRDQRSAQRGLPGDQVRHRARSRSPARARLGRQPGIRAQRGRGQPAPPRRRDDRPVLPAPGRPGDTDRGHRRCDGRPGARRQGPLPRAFRSVGGDAGARLQGPSDRGVAERVFAVDPRSRGRARWPPAAASASASCRTARSDAAS